MNVKCLKWLVGTLTFPSDLLVMWQREVPLEVISLNERKKYDIFVSPFNI
jgi:hypothetical protein